MFVPLTPSRHLYRAVDLYGRKVGIVSGHCRFTYAQFGERCERLAAGLLAHGIAPGDRVAYLSFNTHQLLEGYYGVPLIKAVVMPLNVRLTPPELIAILNHAEARILVFESEFTPLIGELRKYCRTVERFIGVEPGPAADLSLDDLMSNGRIDRPDIFGFDEMSPCELFYTSGSTGNPKGVVLSHRTLYMHGMGVAVHFSNGDNEVELHTIPLFHANGWGRPQSATMLGLTQVMVRRFDPAGVFRLIEEEKANSMSLVPTMANALVNCPEAAKFDLSSMRQILIGGAASSPELIERLERVFPGCMVVAGYGLTETSPVVSCGHRKSTVQYADEAERLRRQAMAGWPVAGAEVRVVDLHMHDVPRDGESIGEVVVRGDLVMDGYYKEPRATAAVMTGNWLHTGDMAVWDEETYIHIVDRKKDIIISGGENISSIEVEKAIFAHPSVLECAVVSAPDEKWGEVPVGFVVLKPGCQLTSEELLAFLAQRLARFKVPKAIEFLEGPLPKTGTGKIVKRALREPFWAGRERRVQG